MFYTLPKHSNYFTKIRIRIVYTIPEAKMGSHSKRIWQKCNILIENYSQYC